MKLEYKIAAFTNTWRETIDDYCRPYHYRYCDFVVLCLSGSSGFGLQNELIVPPDWLPPIPEDETYEVGDIITLEFGRKGNPVKEKIRISVSAASNQELELARSCPDLYEIVK